MLLLDDFVQTFDFVYKLFKTFQKLLNVQWGIQIVHKKNKICKNNFEI